MQPHFTEEQFKKRFVALVLGGRGMPKKREDQHLHFVSFILHLDSERQYSEADLNVVLKRWSAQFGVNLGLDYVTLRRALVDEGYLERDTAGKGYRLRQGDMPYSYDPRLASIELEGLIAEARREREERKRRYMNSTNE